MIFRDEEQEVRDQIYDICKPSCIIFNEIEDLEDLVRVANGIHSGTINPVHTETPPYPHLSNHNNQRKLHFPIRFRRLKSEIVLEKTRG